MIGRHQAIVKERAGGGESFVIEAGAGGEPCFPLSPRADIGASNPAVRSGKLGRLGFKQFRLTVIDHILRPTSREVFDFSS
jgi:hypothetical protein